MNKLIVWGVLVMAIGCGGGKGASSGGSGGSGGGGGSGDAGTSGAAAGAGGTGACVTGREGCGCYGNGTCDGSLQCLSQICVSLTGTGGSSAGTAGTGGATGAGGNPAGAAGTTGTGGATPCAQGSEGCACYGNDTCNGSLRCLSHLCVSLGASGSAGTTGSAGAGGSSATGVAGTTGTAGTIGAAGSPAGSGGTTGSAGTTGSGGAGAAPAGTTGSGGSSAGGSSAAGTNGNTLIFNAGVIAPGSNSFGISGGVYTFSDGAGSTITPNCTTDTCFASLSSAGPICVSGTGTRVLLNASTLDYDYATYWGAAMALDLNNPTNAPMAQAAYVASAHGVKGFQFTFQNKATSTVRMSYKVRDPSTSALVEYCLDLTTSTSAVHFTDAREACYLATPGPALTAELADHVEGIQWQVPTSTAGAVPFNYCISNITPLTQ